MEDTILILHNLTVILDTLKLLGWEMLAIIFLIILK